MLMSFGGAWCCWKPFTPVNVETVTESLFKLYIFYHKWAEWTAKREVYPYVNSLHMCTKTTTKMMMIYGVALFFVVALLFTQFTLHKLFTLLFESIQHVPLRRVSQHHQHCKCFKRPSAALQTSMHSDSKRDSKFPFIIALQLVALSTHKSIVYMATPSHQSSLSTESVPSRDTHLPTNKQLFMFMLIYLCGNILVGFFSHLLLFSVLLLLFCLF